MYQVVIDGRFRGYLRASEIVGVIVYDSLLDPERQDLDKSSVMFVLRNCPHFYAFTCVNPYEEVERIKQELFPEKDPYRSAS